MNRERPTVGPCDSWSDFSLPPHQTRPVGEGLHFASNIGQRRSVLCAGSILNFLRRNENVHSQCYLLTLKLKDAFERFLLHIFGIFAVWQILFFVFRK